MKTLRTVVFLYAALMMPSIVQSATYYFHTDHLGTPQAVSDKNQLVVWQGQYNPFGEVLTTVADIEQNLRFPGQYYDKESELHYNYFRDYDAGLGRYIQSDPIGLLGGLNTYSYVVNNPLKFVDPLGLDITVSIDPSAAAKAGHVGLGVNTPNTVGQRPQLGASGLQIIMGQDVPGEISLDSNMAQSITIPTSTVQDRAVQQCIDQRTQQQQDYNLFNNNCSQFVQQCLNAAGISTSGTIIPKVLFQELQKLFDGTP